MGRGDAVTAYTYTIENAEIPRAGAPLEGSWRAVRAETDGNQYVGPWLFGGTTLCEYLANHPDRDAYAWRVRVWFGNYRANQPSAIVDWEEVREAASAWRSP
jgi:hypothetical protein